MLQYYDKDTRTLTLPWNFNSPLVDLPEDTKIIIFEENHKERKYSRFNQKIKSLPSGTTHLTFGWYFNQPINKGSLPDSLTHLTFGGDFNQPLNEGSLPENLTHLTFERNLRKPVENLPKSLLYLSFWSKTPMDNIPLGVETVNIIFYENDNFNSNIENLPSSVKKIIVNNITKTEFIKKIPFGCEVVSSLYQKIPFGWKAVEEKEFL